ncbi:MAG TPA: 3-hydroxybutyryl-CoA dehydrogenase [Myxococcota bacterium]|jgi:3-hydroxybutyryl-CoA dehydrogenase|nr:3-hydroxybutyryl-CoA dehydrogenase [Myxococcota bacterium]
MAARDGSVRAAGVEVLGVVGAGQMGSGIAQVAAGHGCTVVLADATAALAEKGKAGIAAQLARLVEKGKMAGADRDALLARIRPTGELVDLAAAQIVVEAASENVALKRKLFEDLDAVAPADAVLASNTSSISITLLGAATKRPEKVIGMHWMNPPPLMQLIEIVRGLATDEDTFALVQGLAARFGKKTVTSKDMPGFIVNRILLPMLNEACYALMEGLGTPEDIDQGVKLGLNHPMGPLALADLIGLDTCLAIAEVLHRELGDSKYRPCPLLRQYVAAGWLGRKSGRGFYSYAPAAAAASAGAAPAAAAAVPASGAK